MLDDSDRGDLVISIGIDNGVTGSIGIITPTGIMHYAAPVNKCLNYTKSKQWLKRIDGTVLAEILKPHAGPQTYCMIERPMVNPGRWKATVSAIRALEATQIVLDMVKIPYQFIDSKEWQRVLLPRDLEKHELKTASLEIGSQRFPAVDLSDFDDADGLLIAEFCRRTHFNAPAAVS